jgi:hypothetical protein
VVQHFELGPIGLAVVKRSVPADGVLSVRVTEGDEVAASQEVIVALGD